MQTRLEAKTHFLSAPIPQSSSGQNYSRKDAPFVTERKADNGIKFLNFFQDIVTLLVIN